MNLGQDQQPRFLEDEGMYVGNTPVNPKGKNQNKMEQRILKENSDRNSAWFGTDGKLVALPNPLRKKATRPTNFNQENSELPMTYFCPPMLPGPDGLPLPVNPGGKMPSITQCQLEVDLSSIVFTHHHLFSLEHYLTTKLAELFLVGDKTLNF